MISFSAALSTSVTKSLRLLDSMESRSIRSNERSISSAALRAARKAMFSMRSMRAPINKDVRADVKEQGPQVVRDDASRQRARRIPAVHEQLQRHMGRCLRSSRRAVFVTLRALFIHRPRRREPPMTADPFSNIRIVLVNTTHPGNIGGTARAMKNMGLKNLYLVEPKEFPSDKAVWRSAGATDVLDNAVVVDTLDEAIAGCGLVVGTSARERRIPWPLLDPRECGESVWQEAGQHQVAVVFGREDRGLTNEELHKCNYHV